MVHGSKILLPVIWDDDEWLREHYPFGAKGRSRTDLLAEKRMRQELPYGLWRCADGREVLFNRDYRAIWQRYPSQEATIADRDEDVPGSERHHFYEDGKRTVPWRNAGLAAELGILVHEFRRGRPITRPSIYSYRTPDGKVHQTWRMRNEV
jgi:hypothetical protein